MTVIGSIKQMQIQRASLKAGAKPYRYYDPAPLLAVDQALLTSGGVIGIADTGEQIVDVHHSDHPASKSRQCSNGISLGFTGHYQDMRERFGTHLADGSAGENILVESDRVWTLAELGSQLAIETAAGALVRLSDLLVAAPCVEFSQFAAGQAERLPAEALKETLQFLDDGMRGFYARLQQGAEDALVRVGDRLVLIDELPKV
jgi:hypothetical protein